MNTKTMRRLPPRRILLLDKRNHPNGVTAAAEQPVTAAAVEQPVTAAAVEQPVIAVFPRPSKNFAQFKSGSGETAERKPSNQLLAGYLANEFLTKATLLGEPLDPVRPQTVTAPLPVAAADHRFNDSDPFTGPLEKSGRAAGPKRRRYLEVSNLFRANDTYLPGIVNPPQLARFLKL